MNAFRTIKALVFNYVHRTEGGVDYDALTKAVLTQFPESAWKRTHWAWYRHQILRGRFKDQFSGEERRNLEACDRPARPDDSASATGTHPKVSRGRRGPAARDPEVKRVGDKILDATRAAITKAADDDVDFYFKVNRWVFARLHQDEIRTKRPIKAALWKSGMRTCQSCGEEFGSLKGVEIHRKDQALAYSVENCELLCRDCHQELAGQ